MFCLCVSHKSKIFLSKPKKFYISENILKTSFSKLSSRVVYGNFTPLVFSVNGAMGKKPNKCYFRIAEKLAEKRDEPFSVMMYWIRRKISFR